MTQETTAVVEETTVKSFTAREQQAKTHALVAYILMILGSFTGITWFAGAIWAMVKKSDAEGTPFHDHYKNITFTFWLSFAIGMVGAFLTFFVIGYFILIGLWFWGLYRIIKGVARLTSDKSYKD